MADVSCAQEPPPALRVLPLAAPVTTCTAAEERWLVPANPVLLGATEAQASGADSNTVGPTSCTVVHIYPCARTVVHILLCSHTSAIVLMSQAAPQT